MTEPIDIRNAKIEGTILDYLMDHAGKGDRELILTEEQRKRLYSEANTDPRWAQGSDVFDQEDSHPPSTIGSFTLRVVDDDDE